MDDLQEGLSDLARDLNIDLFGVADLANARDFIMVQGGDHIARFPRAICIGIRLPDAVVDELYRHEEPSAIFSYRALRGRENPASHVSQKAGRRGKEKTWLTTTFPYASKRNDSGRQIGP